MKEIWQNTDFSNFIHLQTHWSTNRNIYQRAELTFYLSIDLFYGMFCEVVKRTTVLKER